MGCVKYGLLLPTLHQILIIPAANPLKASARCLLPDLFFLRSVTFLQV